jgi:hypothetical protein
MEQEIAGSCAHLVQSLTEDIDGRFAANSGATNLLESTLEAGGIEPAGQSDSYAP